MLTKLEDGSPRTEQVDFVTVGKVRVNLLSDANLAILPRRLEFLPRGKVLEMCTECWSAKRQLAVKV